MNRKCERRRDRVQAVQASDSAESASRLRNISGGFACGSFSYPAATLRLRHSVNQLHDTSGVKEIAGTLYVEFKSMVEHAGDLEKVSEDSSDSRSVGRAE